MKMTVKCIRFDLMCWRNAICSQLSPLRRVFVVTVSTILEEEELEKWRQEEMKTKGLRRRQTKVGSSTERIIGEDKNRL